MAAESYTTPVANDGTTSTAAVVDANWKGAARGAFVYAADSSGSDAYAVTNTVPVTSLYNGLVLRFKAGTANTGPATFAPDGLTAHAIVKNYNQPLQTGDIVAGQMVEVVYDETNTQWQMLSPVAKSPQRLIETVAGDTTVSSPTTTETTAISATIPGGQMGTKGMIRVRFKATYDDGSSNTSLTIKVKIGSTTLVNYPNATGTETTGKIWEVIILNNSNAAVQTSVAQVVGTGVVSSVGATVDTSSDFTVSVTMTLAGSSSGAYITVSNSSIELLPL